MSTFLGFVEPDGRLTLDHPAAFKAYIAKRLKGCEVELEIRTRRTKRSDRQNRGYHAMIAPWCQDEGHEPDELKRQLLMHVFGTKEVTNPLTGEVVLVPQKPHTSTLTVREFSDLIEQTLILAAECGVVLMAPDEYRKAHPEKYPQPKRTRAA